MMTPLRFEATYRDDWAELETLLDRVLGRSRADASGDQQASGARLAALYRRSCEHLALARARCYPAHITDRLERITTDAHQLIYRRHEFGLARLRRIVSAEFPAAVRAHAAYVAVAAVAFIVPTAIVGLLVFRHPELILSVVDADTAASFDRMYSATADSIGRTREASTDWMMFGFYIQHNIGVAFQCFAGGLFAGIGSLFFLVHNGVFSGAIGGYLVERGLSSTFFSFVVTHSAFELTAIVLSGAAGLRVGHALLAPGPLTRGRALVVATREAAMLLYGVTAMLLVAAAIEAFWSSASWLPRGLKYTVAALCWTAVGTYFVVQGRRAG
jgi:uncharacterized membrane protein SpoIIM required for sporulation